MCRSIRQLRGATPEPTQDDIRQAALQFVRKISGYRQPSAVNRQAYEQAVDEIAAATSTLLDALVVRPSR